MVCNLGLLEHYRYSPSSKAQGAFTFEHPTYGLVGVYWLAIEFYFKVIQK